MTSHTPSRYRDAMAAVRMRTAPSSSAVGRVRSRLDLQLRSTADLLGALPSPNSFQVARVRARLAGEGRRVPRLGWLLPAGGLAFAAAAAAAVVYATGTEPTPSIGQGTSSPIEATASCGVGGLEACLPTTAAGWLTHARSLEDAGAADANVLAAADAGVALDADAAVLSELEVTRMGALLRSGRTAEALDAAEAALPGAGPDRAEELHRVAGRLALAAGDCARALPHLDALSAPTPDESAHAERCR